MSSTNQTSSPTDSPTADGAGAGVEQFLGHNAAALIILFPFAILLLAAVAKCCLKVSSPAADTAATNTDEPTKKHAPEDWVADLHVDDGELGCPTCGVVEVGPKVVVGSVQDAALVDERVAAGYDGAYRGH
jgi:hypothetical protein